MIAALAGLKPRHWQTRLRDDGVLVLAFDRADANVNAFSQDVLIELDTLLERIALEPPKGVVIASAKTSGFMDYLCYFQYIFVKHSESVRVC